MTNLTTRLEQATEDQQDALLREVWAAIHNGQDPQNTVWYGDVEAKHEARYFLARLDCEAYLDAVAMMVPDGHSWAVGSLGEDDLPWDCVTLQDFDAGCPDFTGSGITPALALAAAILKAKGIE